MITVEYYLSGEDEAKPLMGTEQYNDIDEVVLPKYKSVFTKKFTSDACYRWRVNSVSHQTANNKTVISVFISKLESSINDIYLRKLNFNSANRTHNKIKIGTLVEVDVGFIPNVFRYKHGFTKTNKRYVDNIQNHEPYKRRLAVVVSVEGSGDFFSVALITSQESSQDNVFELHNDSVRNLLDYRSKSSYVICSVVYPVSYSRILPPFIMVSGRKVRDRDFSSKLTRQDLLKLKDGLNNVFDLPFKKLLDRETVIKRELEIVVNEQRNELDAMNKYLSVSKAFFSEYFTEEVDDLQKLTALIEQEVTSELLT